jgi:hypothetical protein
VGTSALVVLVEGVLGIAPLPTGLEAWLWGGGAAAFGAVFGAAELLTRFRDEPWAAVGTKHGVAYVLINALVSAGVFALLVHSHETLFPDLSVLWLALVAGFGAMALLRSKIFTFRTRAGDDVPVGIDAVVRAFLQATDRGVDRERADTRWAVTNQYLHDVDEKSLDPWFATVETHLSAYQSLTKEDTATLEAALATIKRSTAGHAARAVRAGLLLQEVSGTRTFRRVAVAFRAANQMKAV